MKRNITVIPRPLISVAKSFGMVCRVPPNATECRAFLGRRRGDRKHMGKGNVIGAAPVI